MDLRRLRGREKANVGRRRVIDRQAIQHGARTGPESDAGRSALQRAAEALARRCCDEGTHAAQVMHLATEIFDQLECLHGLTCGHRALLGAGARLHDIGWRDGRKGHHKSSRDLILKDTSLPVCDRERFMIAAIARYHRKALPKDTHTCYSRLGSDDRRAVSILGGMVRLADGLDRTHRGLVKRLHCHVDRCRIHLRCFARGVIAEELAAADRKAELLRYALGRKIELDVTPLAQKSAAAVHGP